MVQISAVRVEGVVVSGDVCLSWRTVYISPSLSLSLSLGLSLRLAAWMVVTAIGVCVLGACWVGLSRSLSSEVCSCWGR
jgi:hypothetical protein